MSILPVIFIGSTTPSALRFRKRPDQGPLRWHCQFLHSSFNWRARKRQLVLTRNLWGHRRGDRAGRCEVSRGI